MTRTTKVVAWVGVILGSVAVIGLTLIIGVMIYADYRNAEQHQAVTTLKDGLINDAKSISKMEVKPMTEDEERKFWASPSATK
jgi:hypothetical protein